MKRSIVVAVSAIVFAVGASPVARANAQAPATQRVLSRGLVNAPDRTAPSVTGKGTHVVFGRLETVTGKMLTLRTRSGHLWRVDATSALASGNYSAPLFAGKIVEVDGSLGRAGVIQASGVMRMGSLDSSTPADK